MSKILIPAEGPEDWKQFLANPDRHWKRGYSARTLAYCWHEADGFPASVERALSSVDAFLEIEMLFGIPEH